VLLLLLLLLLLSTPLVAVGNAVHVTVAVDAAAVGDAVDA